MEAERLTDIALALIDDALERTLALGEDVVATDFAISSFLVGPNQFATIGTVIVTIKGPLLGSTLTQCTVTPIEAITPPAIDNAVRTCLEQLRNVRAELLRPTN